MVSGTKLLLGGLGLLAGLHLLQSGDEGLIESCHVEVSDDGSQILTTNTIRNTFDETRTLGWFYVIPGVRGAWAPQSRQLAPGEAVTVERSFDVPDDAPGGQHTLQLHVENMDGDILAVGECGTVTL